MVFVIARCDTAANDTWKEILTLWRRILKEATDIFHVRGLIDTEPSNAGSRSDGECRDF
jgi:hypothetical protein